MRKKTGQRRPIYSAVHAVFAVCTALVYIMQGITMASKENVLSLQGTFSSVY